MWQQELQGGDAGADGERLWMDSLAEVGFSLVADDIDLKSFIIVIKQ